MDSPRPCEGIDPLTVTVTGANGDVWVVVRGEVDLANRNQLRAGLAAIDLARVSHVDLDLRQLGFCDTAGCEILIRFREQAAAAGCDVRFHGAQPIVRKVMSLLGEPVLDKPPPAPIM